MIKEVVEGNAVKTALYCHLVSPWQKKGHVDWQYTLKVLPLLEWMKIMVHMRSAVISTLFCQHWHHTVACVPRSENGGSEELPRHADTTGEDTALFSNRGLYWAAEGRSWHHVVGGMTFSHPCLKPRPSLKGTWCRVFVVVVVICMRTSSSQQKSRKWVVRARNSSLLEEASHFYPPATVEWWIFQVLVGGLCSHLERHHLLSAASRCDARLPVAVVLYQCRH